MKQKYSLKDTVDLTVNRDFRHVQDRKNYVERWMEQNQFCLENFLVERFWRKYELKKDHVVKKENRNCHTITFSDGTPYHQTEISVMSFLNTVFPSTKNKVTKKEKSNKEYIVYHQLFDNDESRIWSNYYLDEFSTNTRFFQDYYMPTMTMKMNDMFIVDSMGTENTSLKDKFNYKLTYFTTTDTCHDDGFIDVTVRNLDAESASFANTLKDLLHQKKKKDKYVKHYLHEYMSYDHHTKDLSTFLQFTIVKPVTLVSLQNHPRYHYHQSILDMEAWFCVFFPDFIDLYHHIVEYPLIPSDELDW